MGKEEYSLRRMSLEDILCGYFLRLFLPSDFLVGRVTKLPCLLGIVWVYAYLLGTMNSVPFLLRLF